MLHLRVLNLLWWKSRLLECQKAKYHSHSSCESEYHTIANTTVELIWITHLLHDLNTFPSNCPILLCDNLSAIFLSQNLVDRGAKHIDIDYHFVRELVSSGKLHTEFAPTKLQVADIFTKPLPKPLFESFRNQLRVSLPPVRLRGGGYWR